VTSISISAELLEDVVGALETAMYATYDDPGDKAQVIDAYDDLTALQGERAKAE
jgi:hypothetical protein